MPRIPDEIIDEVQDRLDIAELIGTYVPLKRVGKHFKGLCPFHKEKTPSFHVNTDKQIFHCFGCGVGGGVFNFVMLHERLTFPEAVRFLADQVHVTVPQNTGAAADSNRGLWSKVLESACQYFERTLCQENGQKARDYLQQRGIDRKTQEHFRLGAAPPGWDHLLKAATSSGHSEQSLEKTGLIIRGKSGFYDRFRERLIFPITDVRGKVLGFGGRTLSEQEPKYLNSPETPIYQKGKHLYGLFQAKDAIVEKGVAVLVEGYFDCISLFSAGIDYAVAPLGTALTVDQIRLLKRYTDQVVLAFDADPAGQQATLRSMDLLIGSGIGVRVAVFPQAKDPDEYVREHGPEAFQRVLAHAADLFEALIGIGRRLYPKESLEDRAKVAQFVLPRIAKLPDAILRSEYSRMLADRLGFEERSVLQDLSRLQKSSSERFEAVRNRKPASVDPFGAESLFTALILEDPGLLDQAGFLATVSHVQDSGLREILDCIGQLRDTAGSEGVSPAQVIARLQGGELTEKIAALVALAQTVDQKQPALLEAVERIQARSKKQRLEDLRNQIQEAQRLGQDNVLETLLTEYQRQVKGG